MMIARGQLGLGEVTEPTEALKLEVVEPIDSLELKKTQL